MLSKSIQSINWSMNQDAFCLTCLWYRRKMTQTYVMQSVCRRFTILCNKIKPGLNHDSDTWIYCCSSFSGSWCCKCCALLSFNACSDPPEFGSGLIILPSSWRRSDCPLVPFTSDFFLTKTNLCESSLGQFCWGLDQLTGHCVQQSDWSGLARFSAPLN